MKIIGRKEKISLPEWGIKNISAKVDTGAYTSSIHCEFWEERLENEVPVLYFKVLDPSHKKYNGKLFHTKSFTQKKVKNSFGHEELRYKVSTKVLMFEEEFEAEFTLSDRSKMRSPILLGRKMLKGRFRVDVQEINLSIKSKK
ncbi:RimK/LysX family protein [Cecembia sp.]|uniref:ATP-dependent zinc protease family protein n=1 Tax=Cecembia sp. TaxID=1898110 RepID=UPI0025C102E3|nr:RimK/LysX family protein [Cecembia sp.]